MIRSSDERGLSLIEMMASLLIFAVITIGVIPLLASSLRGATFARQATLAKSVASEAMERARGLPYYKSIDDQRTLSSGLKGKEDLLDLFYPCASTDAAACPGYSALARTVAPVGAVPAHAHLLTCASGSTSRACATDIPAGMTLYYVAEFRSATGTTSQVVIPPNAPGANYAWDASGRDSPPSQLLQLSITVASVVRGETKTYQLQTLLGDRKFGNVRIAAEAAIDYGIQVETSYVSVTGTSTLSAIGGSATSSLQQRLVSDSSQSVQAGRLLLTQLPTPTNEFPVNLDNTPKFGATITSLAAPPASSPAGPTAIEQWVTHPDPAVNAAVGRPAEFENTSVTGLSVSVANELPLASGGFNFTDAGSDSTGFFYVQNQADTGNNAALRLDPTRKVLTLRRDPSPDPPKTLYGFTNGTTGAMGTSGRRVQTSAEVTLEELRILPTTFITGANARRSVFFLEDFQASVNCKVTASAVTSAGTGSWSATLRIWVDPVNDGLTNAPGPAAPSHVTVSVGATQGGASPNLKAILAAAPYNIPGGNPLVLDDPIDINDVYLFTDTLKRGYLDADGLVMKAPSVVGPDATGTSTSVSIDEAIGITTSPTNPALPESGLRISVGKLHCDALDLR